MTVREHTTVCGLPSWTGMVLNNTAFHINRILLVIVNGSFAIFAFLTNLAIIITVFKKPALQKPSNILLCGLAFADSSVESSFNHYLSFGVFSFKAPNNLVQAKS